MTAFLLHFFLSMVGSVAIFMVFFWLSSERSFSIPFGLVFFGIACGVLAVYVSEWATPVALAAYAVVNGKEWLDDRRDAHRDEGAGSARS